MSLGVVLDVAIGLSLTYMLLALIASALQESVATFLKLRGKQWREGVSRLLAGTNSTPPVIALFNKVFAHSAVQGLSGNGLPSYVPARNFSLALFNALGDGSNAPVFRQVETSVARLPDCPAKESLAALLTQAGGDFDKLKANVETWYDDAMDRLSGDYKRYAHTFALIFGLIVAVVFNVNSVTIGKTLWTDPARRAAIVAIASNYAKQTPPSQSGSQAVPGQSDDLAKQSEAAQEVLDKLPVPIGWSVPEGHTTFDVIIATIFAKDGSGLWAVLGWIATALAVSLGAPFWFDTLQKLFNVRGAGPKPARSDDSPAT